MAYLQPANNATQHGFLVSSVGITAIALGVRALRRQGRSVASRAGVAFGAIGTLAMAYTAAAYLVLPLGLNLPALPWAHTYSTTVLPPGYSPDLSQGTAVRVPEQEARAAVSQAAGTIVALMGALRDSGQTFPPSLAVTTNDRSVVTPDGQKLGNLPSGAVLNYYPSSDLSSYALSISLPGSGGTIEYSTQSGVLTWRW